MNTWRFDSYSAIVGAAVTLALVVLGYIFQHPLARVGGKIRALAVRVIERFTASAETMYRVAVVNWAQNAHALAMVGPLDQVFVPVQLVAPLPRPNPDAELAPAPLPVGTALRGYRHLLVAGRLASGRSTLLAHLAIVHARHGAGSVLGLPVERLPLYVHLTSVNWAPPAEGAAAVDDLTRLVQGALDTVNGQPAAKTALRKSVEAGNAILLLDGWEEMDRVAQTDVAARLKPLADAAPGNLWVVAVGEREYSPLTEAGFTPLRMEDWSQPQLEALVTHCADLLYPPEPEGAQEKGEERAVRPDLHQATDALLPGLDRKVTPFEIALRVWLLLTRGEAARRPGELFVHALEQLVQPAEGAGWTADAARAALGSLALTAQRDGRTSFSRVEIEDVLSVALPPPGEGAPQALAQTLSQVFAALTAPGRPLVARGAERYAFAHILWRACLAVRQMVALDPPMVPIEHLDNLRWQPLWDFFVETEQAEKVVKAWLSKPDDLWRSRLCTAGRWLALLPASASWRNGVMGMLARAFVGPTLPAQVRQRMAEALLQTGDPSLPVFLRQALQHPLGDVRIAAAGVMGLLRQRADVAALARLLHDQDETVRSTAAQAMGRIGTPIAIEQLAQAMVEGDETVQVEAARGLAAAGEAGWEVLREAMGMENFLIRRAAVYGLGQIAEPWAHHLLEKAVREDDQWIVRSAASAVQEAEHAGLPAMVEPPPQVSELAWLITWAAGRGSGVGMGDAAFTPLLQALAEGDPPIRRTAAQTLELVGKPDHIGPLRQAVGDPDPGVARAALRALEEVSRRYGLFVQ